MKRLTAMTRRHSNRRSFLKNGIVAAGAASACAGLMGRGLAAFSREREDDHLSKGDVAILRLLAAAEIIETDLRQRRCEGVASPGNHD